MKVVILIVLTLSVTILKSPAWSNCSGQLTKNNHWPETLDWADLRLWNQYLLHTHRAVLNGGYQDKVTGVITMQNRSMVDLLISGRLIYGLAHVSLLKKVFLPYAEKQASFLLERGRALDCCGLFFKEVMNLNGRFYPGDPASIYFEFQAAALTGLIALYNRTKNSRYLQEARRAFHYLHSTFHDSVGGGYFWKFDLIRKRPVKVKTHDSLISIPLTFAFDLDTILKKSSQGEIRQEQLVAEIADLVAARPVDPLPIQQIQTAWLLMRATRVRGIDGDRKARYREVAQSILSDLLRSEAFDYELGGVHDAYIQDSEVVFWDHKVSWHQGRALLALTLAEKIGLFTDPELSEKAADLRDKTLEFYFKSIVDKEGFGDRLIVRTNGSPVSITEASLTIGTYYQTELAIQMKDMASRF